MSWDTDYREMRNRQIDHVFMDVAKSIASLSHALKAKVGVLIVDPVKRNILSYGYNGTPSGFDNVAEYEIDGKIKTKPEVIHAESNAIIKMALSTVTGDNLVMYTTLSPCFQCSKLIIQANITRLVYDTKWEDDTSGLDLMTKYGITVEKLDSHDPRR